jgi:hypothetical protein
MANADIQIQSSPGARTTPAKKRSFLIWAITGGVVVVAVLSLILILSVASSRLEAANRLVSDAQADVAAAAQSEAAAMQLFQQVFTPEFEADYPDSREKVRADAENAIQTFKQAGESFRAAGKKFKAAAAMPVDRPRINYWTAKAAHVNYLASLQTVRAQMCRIPLNDNLADQRHLKFYNDPIAELRKQVKSRVKSSRSQIMEFTYECGRLGAKAENLAP